MLDVPYHSQEEQDAKHFANDCGPACVSMILEWAGKGRIAVDELSSKTSLGRGDDGVGPSGLAILLQKYGIDAEARADVPLDEIQNEVNGNARPVIALVLYGAIPQRQNLPDRFGGHYVVVVGVDNQTVYVNDPDFWGSQMARGKGLAISRRDFIYAMSKATIPGGAIFVKAMAAEEAPSDREPRLVERAIAPGPAYVTADGLWLRRTPGGDRVQMLDHFERLTILNEPPVRGALNGVERTWVKVRTANGDGWCAEQYLEVGESMQA